MIIYPDIYIYIFGYIWVNRHANTETWSPNPMLDGYCSSESGLHCRATFQARRVCKQSYVPASAKKKELNWSGRGHLPLRNNKTEQPKHGHVTSWGSLRLCFWGHGTMDHPLWLLGFEALQCFAAVAAIIYQHKSTAATTNSLVLHSVARLYVVFDLWVDLSWVVEPQNIKITCKIPHFGCSPNPILLNGLWAAPTI